MRVLVACEESQAVAKAFRLFGHEAYSCDIIECSGGHPEWHIQGDCLEVIKREKWDMIIAFPPCTYLTLTGNRWFNIDKYGLKAMQRHVDREDAVNFFMTIAIENPIGVMSTRWRKPDQVIQPWQFGHETTKGTCLWLKGLSKLKPTNIVSTGEVVVSESGNRMSKWYYRRLSERKREVKHFPV